MLVLPIVTGFLDRRRKLVIAPDYIEYEDSDLAGNAPLRINKSDFDDYCHHWDWIIWYRFTVGKQYWINVRAKDGREIKLSFRNLFNGSPSNSAAYKKAVESIWKNFQQDVVNAKLESLHSNHLIKYPDMELTSSGVSFLKEDVVVPWSSLALKQYSNYFALFSTDDPTINVRRNYLQYGSETIWSIASAMIAPQAD